MSGKGGFGGRVSSKSDEAVETSFEVNIQQMSFVPTNQMPGMGQMSEEGFTPDMNSMENASSSIMNIILLIVSVIVLVIGIVIAKLYKY